MDIEKKLERLKQIQVVETPPYLLQLIKSRIQNLIEGKAPAVWKYAFVACAIIVALFNVTLLLEVTAEHKISQISTVVSSLQLSDSNQLYND